MTQEHEKQDHHFGSTTGAGKVLLHWTIFLVFMTSLIGGAAFIF